MNAEDKNEVEASFEKLLNPEKKDSNETAGAKNVEIADKGIEDMLENCNIEEDCDLYKIDEEKLKEEQLDISEAKLDELIHKALDKKEKGNVLFKAASYEDAAHNYTDGLRLCPLSSTKNRAVLYANRAAALSKISKESMKLAIKDCDKAIECDPTYVKAILRRANYNLELDQLEESLADFEEVLKLDPTNSEAHQAKSVLPSRIAEKNEKLKTEMMGKLKDLGNMILKPFGMSTANFEMNQDAASGGYKINFNQNPK